MPIAHDARARPPEWLVCPGTEERLVAPLREAARTRDPGEILARAAVALHGVRRPAPALGRGDAAMAKALADLAVTGRGSFERFQRTPPDESSIAPRVASMLEQRGVVASPADATFATTAVLDRAYEVARVLRGSSGDAWARGSLGWVAVSGEDDPPHRPVNVAAAPYPQHDIDVTVGSVTVRTRFFVASLGEPPPAPPAPRRDGAGAVRTLPAGTLPVIPDGHRVILFLHGHSSRAEEALGLITPLLLAGAARGKPFSVVSLDLPCNGYSSMLDHTEVAESSRTSFPGGIFDRGRIQTPILDFLEDFIVAFVDALDRITPIKGRFAGVVGGSLGGNLGLRLGRRDPDAFPWLAGGIVSWAAASVWAPMVEDVIKRLAPDHCRERWDEPEDDSRRNAYFHEVFDKVVLPVLIPHTQPSMWYRSDWEHKAEHIQASRRERYEIYNPFFRRWHWRVAGEQLIYSHLDRVDRESPSSPVRHSLNRVRHLLAAGEEDDYPGSNIYSATRHLAERMAHTPGRSLFVLGTGHSIHAERPSYLAGEIASFLTDEAESG